MMPSSQNRAMPSMALVSTVIANSRAGITQVLEMVPWNAPVWPNQSQPPVLPLMMPRP